MGGGEREKEHDAHLFFIFLNYFQRDEKKARREEKRTFFVILLFISGICVCLFIFPEKKKFE
jgi:hypothetical protein